jgi:hypothetical protein
MPDRQDDPDFSHTLRLERTAPLPPRADSLRSGGLRAAAAAQAKAPAESPVAAAPARLGGVAGIAVFEIGRSVVTLLLFAVAMGQPHWRLGGAEWGIYFVASNGSFVPSPFVLPAVLADIAVGWGLWQMRGWARWCAVIFKLLGVLGFAGYVLLFDVAVKALRDPEALARAATARQMSYALFLLNLTLALYLAFSSQAAEAFRRKTAPEAPAQTAPIRVSGT